MEGERRLEERREDIDPLPAGEILASEIVVSDLLSLLDARGLGPTRTQYDGPLGGAKKKKRPVRLPWLAIVHVDTKC